MVQCAWKKRNTPPLNIRTLFSWFFDKLPLGSCREDWGQRIPRSTHVCNDYNEVIVQCESTPPPHCPLRSPQCLGPYHPHHDINLYYGRRQTHQWTVTSVISGESQCHETTLIRPEKWQVIPSQHCVNLSYRVTESTLALTGKCYYLIFAAALNKPVGVTGCGQHAIFIYFSFFKQNIYRLASPFSTSNLFTAPSTHTVHSRSILIN